MRARAAGRRRRVESSPLGGSGARRRLGRGHRWSARRWTMIATCVRRPDRAARRCSTIWATASCSVGRHESSSTSSTVDRQRRLSFGDSIVEHGPTGSRWRAACSISAALGPANSASSAPRRRSAGSRDAVDCSRCAPSSLGADEVDAAGRRWPRRGAGCRAAEVAAIGPSGMSRGAMASGSACRDSRASGDRRDRPHAERGDAGGGRRHRRASSPAARSRSGRPGSPSGRSSTHTRPPCRRTCSSTRARPRPAPRCRCAGRRPPRGRSARRSARVPRSGTPGRGPRRRSARGRAARRRRRRRRRTDLRLAAAVGAGVVDQVGDHAGQPAPVAADDDAARPLA